MKTAKEVLEMYTLSPSRVMQQDYRADSVIDAMQEYALEVAEAVLEEVIDRGSANVDLTQFIK